MTYFFHREHNGQPFCYPVHLASDVEAAENAAHNPGTLKVTRADGVLVWPLAQHRQ